MDDANLIGVAIVLMLLYSLLVLGSCSPIHMRFVSAILGLCCIGISTLSGYGLAVYAGQLMSDFHGVLPFLLLGLGVDDMFVIVNSIDQAPSHLSANERFRIGMMHAGPSITITSVTDGLAFFIGAISTIPALSSFCFYAGFSVVMLYFSFLTRYPTQHSPCKWWKGWVLTCHDGRTKAWSLD